MNDPLTVAVIGSRRRADRATAVACIEALPAGTVIVSGGASGPDTFAAEAARARGLEARVFRPDLRGARGRGEPVPHPRRRFRIVYQVDDKGRTVLVAAIGNRREV